ncbi:MAG: putative toxin-antitoxin system toxin component, PIN family [Kiritimatiellales bacterium]
MSAPVRIVLDSNVIISAILFGGIPARIFNPVMDGSVVCFTSLPVMDEVRDVLLRKKFGLSAEQAFLIVRELHDLFHVVTPRRTISGVCSDPDDDRILECALEADAHFIVSGDAHLLQIKQWEKIQIVTPAQFLKKIEKI